MERADGLPSLLVQVDRELCQGHNRCVSLCPEVFDTDDYGYALVKRSQVGADLTGKFRSAEQNCPENAISVTPRSERIEKS